MKPEARAALARIMTGGVDYDCPMSALTSMGIGGPAWAVVHPKDEREVMEAMAFCREEALPFIMIGNGTNLLVLDRGIEAVVIQVARGLDYIHVHREASGDVELRVGAGLSLRALVGFAAARGISGLEFLVGIPGTVGGAVATNAGAAGRSIGEVITRVRLVNVKRQEHEVSLKNIGFAYRSANLPQDSAVVGASFHLVSGEPGAIRRTMRQHMQGRKRTQPLWCPSAGCVFKNPPGDFAGRLIEAAGLKGLRCGDAQFSDLHANFIVNRGRARATDVLQLLRKARMRVKERAGVELELEIRVLGTPG